MSRIPRYFTSDPAPRTESLADCQARVLQCFEDTIKPRLFEKPKQCVLLSRHTHTLRALMAHVDGVPDDEVPQLHVPNSGTYLNDLTRRRSSSRRTN